MTFSLTGELPERAMVPALDPVVTTDPRPLFGVRIILNMLDGKLNQ